MAQNNSHSSSNQTTSKSGSLLNWRWLVQPHANLKNVVEQRQSQLLSAIILASISALTTIILLAVIIFSPAVLNDPDIQRTVIVILSNIVLYGLNRAGYLRLVKFIYVFSSIFLTAAIPFLDLGSATLLPFAAVTILIIGMFYGLRITIILTIAILAMTFIGVNSMDQEFELLPAVEDAWFFLLLASAFVITFIRHTRRVEELRRQELEEANQKLSILANTLEEQVAERTVDLKNAQAETEKALEKAVEADKVKSQFLASMSHELRTPLNSILAFTDLMIMGTFGEVNDEQEEYLNKVSFSGKHLLSLINDVLDISKMESGIMNLFVEADFDVAKETTYIISTVEKLIGEKDIQLVTDIDSHFPLLAVDKRRIRQVMLNLLSNAVKFTHSGSITFAAKKQEDAVLFAVIDTGPGIAEDQITTIFEPFIQTETGIKHSGGTGLGLPISKRIVQAHDGHLWVESTVGEGSSFYFTIPIAQAKKVGTTTVAIEA